MPRTIGIAAVAFLIGMALAGRPARAQSKATPAASTSSQLLAPAVPATRGLYLDAVPGLSTAIVSPGSSFSLWLDVTPRPGIHVYAPGNRDYLPIALELDRVAGVRAGPVEFPKAEVFVFGPSGERVQVFSRPFRLARRATIDANGKTAITLSGRLEYQACDDKVCYLPQTLPLTWIVPIQKRGTGAH